MACCRDVDYLQVQCIVLAFLDLDARFCAGRRLDHGAFIPLVALRRNLSCLTAEFFTADRAVDNFVIAASFCAGCCLLVFLDLCPFCVAGLCNDDICSLEFFCSFCIAEVLTALFTDVVLFVAVFCAGRRCRIDLGQRMLVDNVECCCRSAGVVARHRYGDVRLTDFNIITVSNCVIRFGERFSFGGYGDGRCDLFASVRLVINRRDHRCDFLRRNAPEDQLILGLAVLPDVVVAVQRRHGSVLTSIRLDIAGQRVRCIFCSLNACLRLAAVDQPLLRDRDLYLRRIDGEFHDLAA